MLNQRPRSPGMSVQALPEGAHWTELWSPHVNCYQSKQATLKPSIHRSPFRAAVLALFSCLGVLYPAYFEHSDMRLQIPVKQHKTCMDYCSWDKGDAGTAVSIVFTAKALVLYQNTIGWFEGILPWNNPSKSYKK